MIFSILISLMLLSLSALSSRKAANIYIIDKISKRNLVERCGKFIGMSNGVNTSRGGVTKNGFASFAVQGNLLRFKMEHSKVSQGLLNELKNSEHVCISYVDPPLLYRKVLVSVKKIS